MKSCTAKYELFLSNGLGGIRCTHVSPRICRQSGCMNEATGHKSALLPFSSTFLPFSALLSASTPWVWTPSPGFPCPLAPICVGLVENTYRRWEATDSEVRIFMALAPSPKCCLWLAAAPNHLFQMANPLTAPRLALSKFQQPSPALNPSGPEVVRTPQLLTDYCTILCGSLVSTL